MSKLEEKVNEILGIEKEVEKVEKEFKPLVPRKEDKQKEDVDNVYKYSRETNQWDKQTFTSLGGQFVGQLDSPLNVGGVNEVTFPSPWLKVSAGKYCIAWRASSPGAQLQALYKFRSTNRFTGQVLPFPSMLAFKNIMASNVPYNPTTMKKEKK